MLAIGPIIWDAFRVHLFKDGFDQLVQVHGYRVDWEKATQCPDFIANDGDQHTIDCPTCSDANGFVYYETTRTKMVIQGIKLEHIYRAEGRFDLGTVLVTSFSDNDVQIWDKITMIDSTERFNEKITRNSVNLTDRTRYFIHGVQILRNPETIFTENEEFSIQNGQIVWANDTVAPTDGDIFTIDYIHHPVYITVEMPNEIRDHLPLTHPLSDLGKEAFEHLPKRIMAKRDYLLRDESLDIRK